jgi:hypothetical protein
MVTNPFRLRARYGQLHSIPLDSNSSQDTSQEARQWSLFLLCGLQTSVAKTPRQRQHGLWHTETTSRSPGH